MDITPGIHTLYWRSEEVETHDGPCQLVRKLGDDDDDDFDNELKP